MSSPSLNLPTLSASPAAQAAPLALASPAAHPETTASSSFAGMLQRRQSAPPAQHSQSPKTSSTSPQTPNQANAAAAPPDTPDAAQQQEALNALLASIPGLGGDASALGTPDSPGLRRRKHTTDEDSPGTEGAALTNSLGIIPTNTPPGLPKPQEANLTSPASASDPTGKTAFFAGMTGTAGNASNAGNTSADAQTSSDTPGDPRRGAPDFGQALAQSSGSPRPSDSLPTGIAQQPGSDKPALPQGPSASPAGTSPSLAQEGAGNALPSPQAGESQRHPAAPQEASPLTFSNLLANAGAAAQAMPTHASNGSSASAPQLPVYTPAGTPGWTEEVSERVNWVANQKESRADLVLNPPELGRIEVSITINGDQTSAQFMAANPVTRELLEQSLPTLRDSLAQNGLQLSQADVGQSGPQSGQPDGQSGQGRRGQRGPRYPGEGEAASSITGLASRPTPQGRGLVDTFA
jgi:flagellar hook-length control protein FliK